MYYDFYVYTDDFADFYKAFEVTDVLVDSVDRDQLRGYNFNRYSEEEEDRRPHITVRLDLENENQLAKVTAKLSEMRDRGIIEDFSDSNPVVTPFKNYSINHHLAHETSTTCALKFYEKKIQNEDAFQGFITNKVAFLIEFIPLWLKYSGFVFQGVNNVSESSSTLISNLAKECGAVVGTVDKALITDIHVFSERLIHTFMNCTSVPRSEEIAVLDNIASRFGYANRTGFIIGLTFDN